MKEQKTADFIKERYPFYDEDLATRDVELNGEQVQELMQSYSDQQNAELRERVKELEVGLAYSIEALKACYSLGASKPIIERLEKTLKK